MDDWAPETVAWVTVTVAAALGTAVAILGQWRTYLQRVALDREIDAMEARYWRLRTSLGQDPLTVDAALARLERLRVERDKLPTWRDARYAALIATLAGCGGAAAAGALLGWPQGAILGLGIGGFYRPIYRHLGPALGRGVQAAGRWIQRRFGDQ